MDLQTFFKMGGYAQYVWPAYGLTALILLWNWWAARRSEAEDMADLLEMVGVPRAAIVLEKKAQNTHEHSVNLCPMFAERQIRRVLLVTSAIHMPRSLGSFQRGCPGVEYIPAPADFRTIQSLPVPWYRHAVALLPTPRSLADFTDASHEYLGMFYYRLRGWM